MSEKTNNKFDEEKNFDLREKRLKLVYKILYVVAAVYVGGILSINDDAVTQAIVPAYTAFFATASLLILKIIKYVHLELQCMKIGGDIKESIFRETEEMYENIWKSLGLELALIVEWMIFNVICPEVAEFILGIVAIVSIIYLLAFFIVKLVNERIPLNFIKIMDKNTFLAEGTLVYYICNLLCLAIIS
ncbi:MAG: hypothetical protein IJ315_02615 [Firmicutes bacterium]|nr:hypothetical protein [Bacillota bacterium]